MRDYGGGAMIITKAYRTEVYPTEPQAVAFRKTCAAVRFVYNWALCRKIEAYRTAEGEGKKYLRQADLQKELPVLKEREPWLREVSGMALLAALQNSDRAFDRFARMVKQEGARPRGTPLRRQPGFMYRWFGAEAMERGGIEYPNLEYYPRFRTARNGLGGFKFFSKIKVNRRGVSIAGIEGEIHLAETDAIPLPPHDVAWVDSGNKNAGRWTRKGFFEYLSWTREDNKAQRLPLGQRRIASGAVTEDRGKWFLSVTFYESVEEPEEPSGVDVLGVHLGLHRLATLSDGTVIPRPQHMAAMEKRLAQLNRSLARGRTMAESVGRRWKQSNDYRERRKKKGDLEAHVANQRKHYAHTLTHAITSRGAKVIVLHAWGIQGMVRDDGKREVVKVKDGKEVRYTYRLPMAKPILDAAWGMLNIQMLYKAAWKGAKVIVAPEEFPATQRCCECGAINKEMAKPNAPTTYCCPCGNARHRDDNAAKNLWWYGHQLAQAAPIP